MKITHVTVSGCGRFGTEVKVTNFGPGVNILSARNEAGKSTLFRAIRTCLFERHSAGGKDIAGLATEGLSLPVAIAVGFEHDGQTYEIRKSFLKSKSASLTRNGTEVAKNAEADEQVWDLLGISPKSTRSLDEATYGLLWVQQGQSFDLARPSEGAKSVLNDVITQEVGTLVGGERARLLLTTVKEELGPLVTETGRPKANGPYDAAIKRADSIRDERLKLEEQLKDLDESLEKLARLRADMKRVSDPAETQRMRRELDEAQKQLKFALEAEKELKACEAAERQAHQLLAAQKTQCETLTERARTIDLNRSQIKTLRDSLAPLVEEEAGLRRGLSGASAKKAALDKELDTLEQEQRRLQRLSDLLAKAASRDAAALRLAALKGFETRFTTNEAALKAATVTDDILKALDSAERDEETLRARISAAAAQISIEAKPDSNVTLNGTRLSGNAVRAVTEPLTIVTGDGTAITVTPPARTVAEAERQMKEVRDRKQAILAAHGAASADDLRRLRALRLGLEEDQRNIRAERMALGIKSDPIAEIQRLAAELAQIDADTARVLDETGASVLPSAEEIETKKQALNERRGVARAEREKADVLVSGRSQQLETLVGKRSGIDGQIRSLEQQLAQNLAQLPDESRGQFLSDAKAELDRREADHRSKAAHLEERRAQSPDEAKIEQLKSRTDRFTSALKNAEDESQRLKTEITRLEAKIEALGGDGLGERAATLKLEHEIASAELARQEERVAVLSLLRQTVEACYDKRREQLSAPLRRHLKPFLHDVFPQAEIELDADFAPSKIRRSGPAAEVFGQLSAGTREQIAVLVRLAMGAMICEKGPDVPVILDDALVFSDDDRIEQMFDAINRAGRNQQVIVFTCRARSFTSLGGTQLQIV